MARSQGSGAPGAGSAALADPASAPEPTSAEGEDDPGAGSGSNSALVAPALPAARRPWLVERLTAAVTSRPQLAGATIAVVVVDLTTGETLFAREGTRGMNLASNAKLLTAIAALGTLGPGFRWRTGVFAAPPDPAGRVEGDLHLRGRGDPLLSVAALENLATELAARGVRTIDGRLVLDLSYFDDQVEPPHFAEQPKERAAFRAPVASLGVARSAATVSVMPNPGGTASVTLEPDAGDYLRLTRTEVVSVTEGRTRLRLEIKPKRDHVAYEITGKIRVGEGTWDFRRRVDDPARFAGEVFKQALAARGITFTQRSIGTGPVPLTARLIAAHDSAPLGEVVRIMNKLSDNYVAESVLKTLGAETRTTPGPATWEDGLAAVRTALAALGVAAGSYRQGNGSGLFAATEVSATQLVTLLAAAHADYRIGPDLLASLPVGGADGTLARRYLGQPARGRVRAKTGTLEKVVSLAGYVGVDSKSPLAFAVLVNDIPAGGKGPARAMTDEMVGVLAAYLGAR